MSLDVTTLALAKSYADQHGGGGGQVQPDWNQSDSTAKDYVKNRPFYTDTREAVFVEETTVEFAEYDGAYMAGFPTTFEATVGETYEVYWDGTIYECPCRNIYDAKLIGNLSIMGMGSDTGEPFLIIVGNGEGIRIATADTSASHTFSISGIERQIVKIPSKYIDKDTSGYIILHKSHTMTEEDVQKYDDAIRGEEVVFVIWVGMCINSFNINYSNNSLTLTTQDGVTYSIPKNNEGLYEYAEIEFKSASLPIDSAFGVKLDKQATRIIPNGQHSGVGTTEAIFQVQSNGTRSKAFDVLGNGEAVAPALILYSSTANSTKKFRITVDDSGALKATEVTSA